jgi:hypothetical protein
MAPGISVKTSSAKRVDPAWRSCSEKHSLAAATALHVWGGMDGPIG